MILNLQNQILAAIAAIILGADSRARGIKPKAVRTSSRKVAECGTRAGYNRHLKQGEPTCADCKQAQLEGVQRWKASKR